MELTTSRRDLPLASRAAAMPQSQTTASLIDLAQAIIDLPGRRAV
jgi:hypothetical protein